MNYDHHCRELLRYIGVSAVTGDGIDEFWNTIDAAAQDFYSDYLQDLKIRMEEQQAKKQAIARDSMNRLANDLNEAKISKETNAIFNLVL